MTQTKYFANTYIVIFLLTILSLINKTDSSAFSAPALAGGTISNPAQTIIRNTIPAQINCSVATGGILGYSYQWQRSTDNINFTDISGATSQNYTPPSEPFPVTRYFRRKVTSNGGTAYSTNKAIIIVVEYLYGGYPVTLSQTININNAPDTLKATSSSGGVCGSYIYQWGYTTATNPSYTIISGATGQFYKPGPLTVTTYFYRVTTCGSSTANFSDGTACTVNVTGPLDAGCITSAMQQVLFGSIPTTITATVATSGSCGLDYNYQWQSSTDNIYFINIPGANSQNLSFSVAPTQTTWYQRKTTCGTEVRYTRSLKVTMTSVLTYYNTNKSGTFTKNNCDAGYTGSSVTYTVAAGAYTSTISQADADQKAQNDVNTNGQVYANNNGTCISASIPFSVYNHTYNSYTVSFDNNAANVHYSFTVPSRASNYNLPGIVPGTYDITVTCQGANCSSSGIYYLCSYYGSGQQAVFYNIALSTTSCNSLYLD